MLKDGAPWRLQECQQGNSVGAVLGNVDVLHLSLCVCVTVILDRKRLRCGLGIRCVSVRTVIKKHSTQSTKSRGRSRRPSKKGALADLCTEQSCSGDIFGGSLPSVRQSSSWAIGLRLWEICERSPEIRRGSLLRDGKKHYNHYSLDFGGLPL